MKKGGECMKKNKKLDVELNIEEDKYVNSFYGLYDPDSNRIIINLSVFEFDNDVYDEDYLINKIIRIIEHEYIHYILYNFLDYSFDVNTEEKLIKLLQLFNNIDIKNLNERQLRMVINNIFKYKRR